MKSPTHSQEDQDTLETSTRTVDECALLVREIRFWDRILHKSLLFCTPDQERKVRQLIGYLHDYEVRFFPAKGPEDQKNGRAPADNRRDDMAHLELQILKQEMMEALDIMLTPRIF